jgi:hypothetical protein
MGTELGARGFAAGLLPGGGATGGMLGGALAGMSSNWTWLRPTTKSSWESVSQSSSPNSSSSSSGAGSTGRVVSATRPIWLLPPGGVVSGTPLLE